MSTSIERIKRRRDWHFVANQESVAHNMPGKCMDVKHTQVCISRIWNIYSCQELCVFTIEIDANSDGYEITSMKLTAMQHALSRKRELIFHYVFL